MVNRGAVWGRGGIVITQELRALAHPVVYPSW